MYQLGSETKKKLRTQDIVMVCNPMMGFILGQTSRTLAQLIFKKKRGDYHSLIMYKQI